jgi:hypothetical protein
MVCKITEVANALQKKFVPYIPKREKVTGTVVKKSQHLEMIFSDIH